mmetsp:Transcript_47375/g.110423  ORF Transcript_47375/g.110423 Transcript_47375/m.110423 type:complete len:250 (-) Transcript_47375:156-905(-)
MHKTLMILGAWTVAQVWAPQCSWQKLTLFASLWRVDSGSIVLRWILILLWHMPHGEWVGGQTTRLPCVQRWLREGREVEGWCWCVEGVRRREGWREGWRGRWVEDRRWCRRWCWRRRIIHWQPSERICVVAKPRIDLVPQAAELQLGIAWLVEEVITWILHNMGGDCGCCLRLHFNGLLFLHNFAVGSAAGDPFSSAASCTALAEGVLAFFVHFLLQLSWTPPRCLHEDKVEASARVWTLFCQLHSHIC